MIVLASASPRRRQLLDSLGIEYVAIPAEIDESEIPGDTPEEFVCNSASAKALKVAEMLEASGNHGDAVVIAADTVVVIDGKILGKPSDRVEAAQMLRTLNGRTHQVFTGLAVSEAGGSNLSCLHEVTRVKFRRLSPSEIDRYVRTDEPMDKAGAYAIQGLGALLVERIEGCYFNVMGLPLSRLASVLRNYGIRLL